MALADPFNAYDARDSIEAHFICNLIRGEGMGAYVIDDVSGVGLGAWTGMIPGLHQTQVWIERADAERVKPILDAYKQREQERRERTTETEDDFWAGNIRVVCDECEQTLSFPVAQRGAVEVCPHCGRHVDVDDSEDEEEEWWQAGGEHGEPPT